MRVKSAVARLNMSPRPMLSRAVFKFTSEFRVNLQNQTQVLSLLSGCFRLLALNMTQTNVEQHLVYERAFQK